MNRSLLSLIVAVLVVVASVTAQTIVTGVASDRGGSPSSVLAQGTIQGTVTDESTGAPLPWVQIQIFTHGGSPPESWVQALTNMSGKYTATLPPGTYVLNAIPPYTSFRQYASEWHSNAPNRASATPVVVAEGAIVHVDFALGSVAPPPPPDPGRQGIVKGTVIDESTKAPIPGVHIRFFLATPPATSVTTATTDALGKYEASLIVGSYLMRADPPPPSSSMPAYVPEWFDNVFDPTKATQVTVGPGSSITANFALSVRSLPNMVKVTGTVTDALGKPLALAKVVFMHSLQEMQAAAALTGLGLEACDVEGLGECRGVVWMGTTDALGRYTAEVASGLAYIALATKSGYQVMYYKGTVNPLEAEIIKPVTDVKGIDFVLPALPLPPAHSVSGSVKDAKGTGIPSRVVLMPVVGPGGSPLLCYAHTDANGKYSISPVPTGKYRALALPFNGYAPAYYKPGAYGVRSWQDAAIISVAGNVADVDIGVVPILSPGMASLRGRIHAKSGQALSGALVRATTSQQEILGVGVTDRAGEFFVEGLPTGAVVVTGDREGYQSVEENVSINSYDVTGIDLEMSPVTATDVSGERPVPTTYRLDQNYPNPFNPKTVVSIQLPVGSDVRLAVYDLLGREVAVLVNEWKSPGTHEVEFDGSGLASGLYVCRLIVGEYVASQKMLLTK